MLKGKQQNTLLTFLKNNITNKDNTHTADMDSMEDKDNMAAVLLCHLAVTLSPILLKMARQIQIQDFHKMVLDGDMAF